MIPLIDASAAQDLAKAGLAQLVDGTWLMPGSSLTRETLAQTTAVADTNTIKALPAGERPAGSAEIFSRSGVRADTLLCVYDRRDNFSAPWVLWLLASLGANVALIEDWQNAALGEAEAIDGNFTALSDPRRMNATKSDVLAALGTDIQIIDARSAGRFTGSDPEPRPECRSGHIPGSVNLHYALIKQGAAYRELDEIAATVKMLGIDLSRPIITTCGSGVTASILALAFYRLGARDIRVYQGSWAEWGVDQALPVETG